MGWEDGQAATTVLLRAGGRPVSLRVRPGSAAPPADPQDLELFRDGAPYRFPPAFVELLEVANAAAPVDDRFQVAGEERRLVTFLGFDGRSHVERDLGGRSFLLGERFGFDAFEADVPVVPIADVADDDYLVFDFRDGGRPLVALLDTGASTPDHLHLTPVASSFEDLIAMLRPGR